MAAGEPQLHRLLRHFLEYNSILSLIKTTTSVSSSRSHFFNCQPCSKCGRTFLPLAGPTRTLERGPADYIRRRVGEFRLMGGVQNEQSRLTCRMAFECLELSPEGAREASLLRTTGQSNTSTVLDLQGPHLLVELSWFWAGLIAVGPPWFVCPVTIGGQSLKSK